MSVCPWAVCVQLYPHHMSIMRLQTHTHSCTAAHCEAHAVTWP